MDIPLNDVVYFDFITSSPASAAATDADSTPTFAVYQNNTDTDVGVGGNAVKRTSLTGNYRVNFTASGANGFSVDKWYNVVASATVSTVAAKGVIGRFRIIAAENVAGYPITDTMKWAGDTIPARNVTGVPIVDLKYILGTALTETSGQIAAAFKQFFNIGSPTSTMNEITLVDTVTNLTNAPTAGDLTATMKTSVTNAVPTAAANATALLDASNGVETGYTLRQALKLILASLAGKLSGAATTSVSIRDVTDSKTRIAATVDSDGNRTAFTYDLT